MLIMTSTTIPGVEASDPESLTLAGSRVGASATAVRRQHSAGRKAVAALRDGWAGAASDAAANSAQRTLAQQRQLGDALQRLQAVLQDGGAQLGTTRAGLLHNVKQLRQQGWQLGPDGTVTVMPGSRLDRLARLSPVTDVQLQQLAARNATVLKTLLAQFDSQDRQLARDLRNAIRGVNASSAD
ncbi:hypothetical protein AWC26_10320 [Mycobacterium shimoidei]|uniref:Uncharacterized protein n=2 Tax=Mycobacterium shimoidei TaxID=29313 RepID=A0A1E3TDP5_MYCSH|nr:hypothetical protein BHQ16_15115 [Mycobacterium shimoidei]ORW80851.1 hypothetical protein AWC26_10320 [Mycobacterium shimoidei]SRX92179.1 hypothetical protein MSP7336_00404 [Mycobacterium shimoidei]